jgi:transcriptional regulator with XRE-family HTH domain
MNKRLGELLRARRERAGLSQDEVAQQLAQRRVEAASRETVSRQERGAVAVLKPDMVNALAEVLPVTVTELCEAMGYRVGDTPITIETGEMVALYNMLPRMLRPVFLEGVRGLAQGLLRTVPQSGGPL